MTTHCQYCTTVLCAGCQDKYREIVAHFSDAEYKPVFAIYKPQGFNTVLTCNTNHLPLSQGSK